MAAGGAPSAPPPGDAAREAAAGKQTANPRRGGGARHKNKQGKCRVFREFLQDTFGGEVLRGTVLDIGGGKGELSFDLCNLNGSRAIVVDPRPMSLGRVARRYEWFHRRLKEAHADEWNARAPPPVQQGATAAEEGETGLEGQGLRTEGGMCSTSGGGGDGSGERKTQYVMPEHWRLMWVPQLWSAAPGGAGAGDGKDAVRAAWEAARGLGAGEDDGRGGEGSKGGASHGLDISRALKRLRTDRGGGGGGGVGGAEPPLAPQGAGCWCASRGGCTGAPPGEGEVASALAAASLVVGLHSDQATEWIVDFALARGVPFAVVPCCVCASEFPGRALPDGTPVTTHPQFVEYLRAKAAGVRSKPLAVDGRNVCVFWRGPGGGGGGGVEGGGDEGPPVGSEGHPPGGVGAQ